MGIKPNHFRQFSLNLPLFALLARSAGRFLGGQASGPVRECAFPLTKPFVAGSGSRPARSGPHRSSARWGGGDVPKRWTTSWRVWPWLAQPKHPNFCNPVSFCFQNLQLGIMHARCCQEGFSLVSMSLPSILSPAPWILYMYYICPSWAQTVPKQRNGRGNWVPNLQTPFPGEPKPASSGFASSSFHCQHLGAADPPPYSPSGKLLSCR